MEAAITVLTESRTSACALPAAASTALIGMLLYVSSSPIPKSKRQRYAFSLHRPQPVPLFCLVGATAERPRFMQGPQRGINALQTLPPSAGIEAISLESVRQRKRNNNSCGQQCVGNHSVHRGEPPFAKSLVQNGLPSEPIRKHKRAHTPYLLKVHYVDAPVRYEFDRDSAVHFSRSLQPFTSEMPSARPQSA